MIRAREPLDISSVQQQFFEQNVLMHLKGLQIRSSGGWGQGNVSFMNNMLLNSYDVSYLIYLALGPPQNFQGDTNLNTRQLSQIAEMLCAFPPNGISMKLDLGNINNRVFLRILKSFLRKVRRLSELSFKLVECQGMSWLGVISALKHSQPRKVIFQMRESQFFVNKEKMRANFQKLLEKAEELSFESYPLKVKSRIGWFADTQRMMDVFGNLRKIHIDPFCWEDSYCFNYQRLFNTMTSLEEVSLVCYNRDYFRKMTTHFVLPETLKSFQITFMNLVDKESWRNILINMFSNQYLPRLESLQIAVKFKPINFFLNQKLPTINEFSLLEGLHCPNLKNLKLKLALIQRVSLRGLEKLVKLENLELEVSTSVKKVIFAEGDPLPSSLKRFSFAYCAEKPFSDYKSDIYYYFWTFLKKKEKELKRHFFSQLSELRLSEVLVNNEIIPALSQESLESLTFCNSVLIENEFTKLLNSDRLASLRRFHIQASHLRGSTVINNENIIRLIAESSLAEQLEELSIVSMSFNDGNLQSIQLEGLKFPKLKKLNLSQNVSLGFYGLKKIFQIKMPCLEYLNIEHIKCSYTDLQTLLIDRASSLKELKLDANEIEIVNLDMLIGFRRKFLKFTNYGLFANRT